MTSTRPYPRFREVLDQACRWSLTSKTLCFEGPEEQLSQTRYTQPCMVAFAVGDDRVCWPRRGIRPRMAPLA